MLSSPPRLERVDVDNVALAAASFGRVAFVLTCYSAGPCRLQELSKLIFNPNAMIFFLGKAGHCDVVPTADKADTSRIGQQPRDDADGTLDALAQDMRES
jgi:hypothetical protein